MAHAQANRAIDTAFREVALIHDRMSFQEGRSDVSRLNRDAPRRPVAVHPYTLEVLEWSMRLAGALLRVLRHHGRGGARRLGLLSRPESRYRPDPQGSWRDIELREDGTVRFHRPVWIDLSGIAKGYAVDRAIGRLRDWGSCRLA